MGKDLLIIIVFVISFGCSVKESAKIATDLKRNQFVPPVTFDLDSMPPPKRVELKNMPPPRVIHMPKKPGGSYTIHTESGEEKIPLSPPINAPVISPLLNFTNFATDKGLSFSDIGPGIMDSKGQLWFGSYSQGLFRYDGNGFTNYNSIHGLVNNQVTCITEDREGHLWIGTNNGISMFDGIRFANYKKKDGLVDDVVFSSIMDRKGNLWFGTYTGGVSRYDGRKFTTLDTSNGLPSNNVNRIMEDKKGNLWFATFGGGLSRYDGRNFTNFTMHDGLPTNYITNVVEDKKGTLWIGTYEKGVIQFDGTSFKSYNEIKGISNLTIYSVAVDKDENIWFATSGNGVFCYDGKKFEHITRSEGLINNTVNSITTDQVGNVWFGTQAGFSCYRGKSINIFSENENFTDRFVNDITVDQSGDLWLATWGYGVVRFDGRQFTNFNSGQGLGNNIVYSIEKDQSGTLWMGTMEDGLHCFDGASITTYTTDQGLVSNRIWRIAPDHSGNLWICSINGELSSFDGKGFTRYTSEQGFPKDIISSIYADSKGNIWFGFDNSGLCRLTDHHLTLFTTEQGLGSNSVNNIMEDFNGSLWFATSGGVSRYDGRDFYTLTSREGLSNDIVKDIVEDSEGAIWMGTNDGISGLYFDTSLADHQKGKFIGPGLLAKTNAELKTYITHWENYSVKTGYPLKSVQIMALTRGNKLLPTSDTNSSGIIWAGYLDTKLISFNPKAVHKSARLPVVRLKGVRIDESSLNWYGLNSMNFDSSVIVQQEAMVFGSLLTNQVRDSLQNKFNEIKFDSITAYDPIPQGLVLPFKHNRVSIDFGAIETSRPFMVRYQYMLEGYDPDWSPITEKTTVSYGNIHEGSYTFKLKALSPEGRWSEPILYTFKVLPPWYRSWWAYALYIISFLASVAAFVKWRTKSLIQQKLNLEEKVSQRTQQLEHKSAELEQSLINLKSTQSQLIQSEKMASLGELTAGIAHEIQNPLNFVNNFSELSHELLSEMDEAADKGNINEVKAISADIRQNLEKINHHGKRADSIVKGMLQHSQKGSGHKEPTDINSLSDEFLRLSFHGLKARDNSMNVTIVTSLDETIGEVDLIKQDISRVLLNLYNNAFYAVAEKFKITGEKFNPTVTLTTKKFNDHIEITVKDNGLGIPESIVKKIFQPFFTTKPAGQGTGLGLSLSYDIVKAHGGEFRVESKEGEGTEFKVILPV